MNGIPPSVFSFKCESIMQQWGPVPLLHILMEVAISKGISIALKALRAANLAAKIKMIISRINSMDKLEDISDIRKIPGILESTKAYKAVAEAISRAARVSDEFAAAIRTGAMYGDDVTSTVASVALDTADANVVGRGMNGIWRNNPSIVRTTLTNIDEIIALYRRTLTDGYIDELVAANPAKFAGKNISSIKAEMSKLREMIQKTKDAAREAGKYYNNNPLEPSFETNWLVENCAEIWAVRDAILQGSKVENIVIRSVNIANGSLKPLCKNCTEMFSDIIKAME